MPHKKLALIHTSATLVPVFAQLCREKLPAVEVFNIVDDSLVKGIREAGHIPPGIYRRVAGYLVAAELGAADFALVTCSSIGPAVEVGAAQMNIPVMRVDLPMADAAVLGGKRIGVVATLRTTLEPTAELIQRRAALHGKSVELQSHLCEGAFEALMAGDTAAHDAAVGAALQQLAANTDVIVLAQASMARVADALPATERRVPILASPATAIDFLASQPVFRY